MQQIVNQKKHASEKKIALLCVSLRFTSSDLKPFLVCVINAIYSPKLRQQSVISNH